MNYNKKHIEELNELLEKNYDAIKGYQEVMDESDNSFLNQFFRNQINERKNFVSELSNVIRSFGEKPVESGSVTGALHRGWINIKSTFSSNNEEALIEECIRGEEAAVEEYEEILRENKYDAYGLNPLVRNHLNRISSALSELKEKEEFYD